MEVRKRNREFIATVGLSMDRIYLPHCHRRRRRRTPNDIDT